MNKENCGYKNELKYFLQVSSFLGHMIFIFFTLNTATHKSSQTNGVKCYPFSILTVPRCLGIVYGESCTFPSRWTVSGFCSWCLSPVPCVTPPGDTGTLWLCSAPGAEMPEWHQSASPPLPSYGQKQQINASAKKTKRFLVLCTHTWAGVHPCRAPCWVWGSDGEVWTQLLSEGLLCCEWPAVEPQCFSPGHQFAPRSRRRV